MDLEGLARSIWPWLWPSASLLVWSALAIVVSRRVFAWLGGRASRSLDARVLACLEPLLTVGALVVGLYAWMHWAPLPPAVADVLDRSVDPWFWPSLFLLAWITLGFWVLRRMAAWLGHRVLLSETRLDDILVGAARVPAYILLALLGVRAWVERVPVGSGVVALFEIATKGAAILAVVLFASGLLQGWLLRREATSRVLATSGGVIRTSIKVAVLTIGVLMVLGTFGIDVTPLLASLGLGSLAIGLALQKTLEDFISGLLLAADQPLHVGDFVQLDTGEAGTVLAIGWRTTRIRTRDEMHVIVPNGRLAQATLINRSRPRPDVMFTVAVGVHYQTDLDRAAAVMCEVGAEIMRTVPGADPGWEPHVRFRGFGESSIDAFIWLRAGSWLEHFAARDAFIRALRRRFAEEGIVIPFPIRTLDVPVGTTVRVERPQRGDPPGPAE